MCDNVRTMCECTSRDIHVTFTLSHDLSISPYPPIIHFNRDIVFPSTSQCTVPPSMIVVCLGLTSTTPKVLSGNNTALIIIYLSMYENNKSIPASSAITYLVISLSQIKFSTPPNPTHFHKSSGFLAINDLPEKFTLTKIL
ncbi:hypothetical protein KP79_PYT13064 [Mizuhopecten yessoensis]|uniref:Uncharacterized protein n=1 Tax=Mizuhopecten yessoensis TaxID=6573 RepID=A0A210QFW0_MIZYE|nr:hypothetical protein KP79_PYT13064 [Mizuhopecten yessoensis]